MYEVMCSHHGTVYYGSSYKNAIAAFERFKRRASYIVIFNSDGVSVKEFDRVLETIALQVD